jgi:hypothetical protein
MTHTPTYHAHRGDTDETWRIDRLKAVYETADRLIAALGPDAPGVGLWSGSIIDLHDHKGTLTVLWTDAVAIQVLSWAVKAAWNAQSEYTPIVHKSRPLDDDIPW